MPEGLRELMSDITREVLRYQPENIESFIADYLEAMLLTRELCHIANQTIEDVLDSSCQIVEYLRKDGVTVKQAESAVEIMKDEFRNHIGNMGEDEPMKELNIINRLVNECKLTIDQAQSATDIIESAWCHYYQRNKQNVAKVSPAIAQHDAVRNTLLVYQKTKASCLEMKEKAKLLEPGLRGYSERKTQLKKETDEMAAIRIQAWYRGEKVKRDYQTKVKAAKKIQAGYRHYKAHKQLKRSASVEDYVKDKLKDQDLTRDEAAIVIQAHIRGFNVRKKLHQGRHGDSF